MTTNARQRMRFEELHERLRQQYGSRSLYDALGVKPGASEAEIRKQFRQKALKWHPDRNKAPDAEQRFKDVNAVYEVLSAPAKRHDYDSFLGITSGKAQAGTANAAGSPASHHTKTRASWVGSGNVSDEYLERIVNDFAEDRISGEELIRRVRPDQWDNFRRMLDEYWAKKEEQLKEEMRKRTEETKRKFGFGGFGTGVNVSGRRVHFGKAHDGATAQGLDSKVDKMYEAVYSRVRVFGPTGNITLGLSNDDKIHVNGTTIIREPSYSNGELLIGGFTGRVYLPQTAKGLNLDVETVRGSIAGDVAHQGRIKTSAGSVNLHLHAPLEVVIARTSVGMVNVEGMIWAGGRLYMPPNKRITGMLAVETSVGNVNVKYVG